MIDYLATFAAAIHFARSPQPQMVLSRNGGWNSSELAVSVVGASCILPIGHQANPNVRDSAASRVRGVLGFPNDG
jgi:hypothetical protein